jgi:hypothetical protein
MPAKQIKIRADHDAIMERMGGEAPQQAPQEPQETQVQEEAPREPEPEPETEQAEEPAPEFYASLEVDGESVAVPDEKNARQLMEDGLRYQRGSRQSQAQPSDADLQAMKMGQDWLQWANAHPERAAQITAFISGEDGALAPEDPVDLSDLTESERALHKKLQGIEARNKQLETQIRQVSGNLQTQNVEQQLKTEVETISWLGANEERRKLAMRLAAERMREHGESVKLAVWSAAETLRQVAQDGARHAVKRQAAREEAAAEPARKGVPAVKAPPEPKTYENPMLALRKGMVLKEAIAKAAAKTAEYARNL